MISMTGYTKQKFKLKDKDFFIIIRSLNNNRGLDIGIKTPRYLLEIEPEIRKTINKELIRGKIDLRIEENNNKSGIVLDQTKLQHHIQTLKQISPKTDSGYILNAAISLPDIFESRSFKITKNINDEFLFFIKKSIESLKKYREKEGNHLTKIIKSYIKNILKLCNEIQPLESIRKQKKRKKLLDQIKNISNNMEYDSLKLEAEMIYYFEKNDITEERIRLNHHCKFFLDVIKKESVVGKKLSFISQEILREINTIGSKANDFAIQKKVIKMKEEIEKTKEQLQNIL